MEYLILTLITVTSANAAEYKSFYTVNGKQTDTSEALIRALKGEEVMKCQTVEAKANKTGSSIALHNVKKPKAN